MGFSGGGFSGGGAKAPKGGGGGGAPKGGGGPKGPKGGGPKGGKAGKRGGVTSRMPGKGVKGSAIVEKDRGFRPAPLSPKDRGTASVEKAEFVNIQPSIDSMAESRGRPTLKDASGGSDGRGRALNDDGEIAALVTLSSGQQGIFVLNASGGN